MACLHTEGGRTERYRHYMRHKTPLNERQLAIITELMLRGKQQLGELRTRASRMVAIETQDDLRTELQALIAMGLVRANGPLDRRGIEVDHDLYPHNENHEALAVYSGDDAIDEPVVSRPRPVLATPTVSTAAAAPDNSDQIDRLETTVRELRDELATVREDFQSLRDQVDELRRQLGG